MPSTTNPFRVAIFSSLRELVPNFEERVPGSCSDGHAIFGDADAADAVLVSGQNSDSLFLNGIPGEAVVVVVTGEKKAPRPGEGDRSDARHDAFVGVRGDALIRTDIEEAAREIVASGGEGVAGREGRNGVDVGLVALECLTTAAATNVPQFGRRVAGAGNEGLAIG